VLPGRRFATRLRSSQIADLIRSNAPVIMLLLNDAERDALEERNLKTDHLGKLEWIFWRTGSNGELREGLHGSQPYRLRRWPDFSRLPHYRSDVRMAKLLRAERLTVGELAERSGVRLETSCNFVNACWSMGFLDQPPPASAAIGAALIAAPEKTEQRAGGLLALLRAVLRRAPKERAIPPFDACTTLLATRI
jgi:hypothetical protein